MIRRPPRSTPFPSTTLFRSFRPGNRFFVIGHPPAKPPDRDRQVRVFRHRVRCDSSHGLDRFPPPCAQRPRHHSKDRKSTRLNSSHANISYAVFCLKKKTAQYEILGATVAVCFVVGGLAAVYSGVGGGRAYSALDEVTRCVCAEQCVPSTLHTSGAT